MMSIVFQLWRVRQWVKNLFMFLPLVFAGKFYDPVSWVMTLKAFIGFSLIASAFYIVNDLVDRRADTLHPVKSRRPLASGCIPGWFAGIFAAASFLTGMFALKGLEGEVWGAVGVYVLIQIAYNAFLKHWVIFDVIAIAVGFVVRVWVGAAAGGIIPSLWLQLCVFALALFLGFAKRRQELIALRSSAADHRPSLSEYTPGFLDQMITIASGLVVVFYGLYAISAEAVRHFGGAGLLYSIVFVIYGVLRYLYLIHVKDMGDDPAEVLLRDRPLLINVCMWLFFVVMVVRG